MSDPEHMGPACSICAHEAKDDINHALLGGISTRGAAGQFGVSKSAVDRHRRSCLRARWAQTMARDADLSAARLQSYGAGLLEDSMVNVMRVKQAMAVTPDDRSLWAEHRAALEHARRQLETLARLGGLIGPSAVVQVDARKQVAVLANLSEDELRALARGDANVIDGTARELPGLVSA
jgi:hypothetical protein